MAGAEFHSIFRNTAEAVVRAQRALEGRSDPAAYSIPRLDAAFQFELTLTKEKKFLFVPRGSRTERRNHRVRFSLTAVPDPPDVAAPLEGVKQHPLTLVQPPFLLTEDQERARCREAVEALRAGLWTARLPGNKPLEPGEAREEAERIEEALSNPAPGMGMIGFRLAGEPESWLLVRVTEEDKNDALLVLAPSQPKPLVIFSAPGDDSKQVLYEPLHRLVLTIREWLAGAAPVRVPYDAGLPVRWGLPDLNLFAQKMVEGYWEGLQYLAQAGAEGRGACFDLSNVEVELAVAVRFDKKAPRFTMAQLPAAEEEAELMEARVALRAQRTGPGTELELELVEPGFVLGRDALELLREAVGRSEEEIAAEFAERGTPSYFNHLFWLRAASGRERVVGFLSAERGEGAQKILVIWPGANLAGAPRDFTFVAEARREREGWRLGDIEDVMSLEDLLGSIVINGLLAEASREQYEAFYHFFRAVRVWRAGMAQGEAEA